MEPSPTPYLPPPPCRPATSPAAAPAGPCPRVRVFAPRLVLLGLLGSLLLAGCGGPSGTGPGDEAGSAREEAGAAAEEAEPIGPRSYTVQGVVRQLPDPRDASKQLLIHHAPIPDYVNSDGYEIGMPSMTMPFFPAASVELGEIVVGDWVEFTLRVDWQATPAMELTAIRRIEPPEASQ